MEKKWRRWKHKNIIGLVAGLVLAGWLWRGGVDMGRWGAIGAVVAGALFVNTFTTAGGMVLLWQLGKSLGYWETSLLAGVGAMLANLVMFKFVKNDLTAELKPIYNRLDRSHLFKLLHTKHFRWTLPVLGAILIASPLPDEIGVGLLGFARLRMWQFTLVSFALNTVGILAVLAASV